MKDYIESIPPTSFCIATVETKGKNIRRRCGVCIKERWGDMVQNQDTYRLMYPLLVVHLLLSFLQKEGGGFSQCCWRCCHLPSALHTVLEVAPLFTFSWEGGIAASAEIKPSALITHISRVRCLFWDKTWNTVLSSYHGNRDNSSWMYISAIRIDILLCHNISCQIYSISYIYPWNNQTNPTDIWQMMGGKIASSIWINDRLSL